MSENIDDLRRKLGRAFVRAIAEAEKSAARQREEGKENAPGE